MAVHGFRCGARTIPLNCRYCRASIFYFRCECGSRVLFEELGPPWPQHRCLDHFAGLVEGVGKANLERLMTKQMTTVRVDWTYARWARDAFRDALGSATPPGRRPREIVALEPYPGIEAEEEGIVRELNPAVDVRRRFDVEPHTIGEAALGEIGRESQAQVTVHTGALGDDDDFSFTFLVPRSKLAHGDIGIGDLVRFRLRGVAILDRDPAWVCDRIDLLA